MSDFRLCVRAPMLRERRAPVRMLRVRVLCLLTCSRYGEERGRGRNGKVVVVARV